jgi:RNA binding exosome subunit
VTEPSGTFDVDAAVLDPAAHFGAPIDVVNDSRLTKAERQRILESWVRDAELLSQAEAENMQGTQRTRLQEATLALLELQKQQ